MHAKYTLRSGSGAGGGTEEVSNRRELRSSLGFATGVTLLLAVLAICGLCLVGVGLPLLPDVNDSPSNKPDGSDVL